MRHGSAFTRHQYPNAKNYLVYYPSCGRLTTRRRFNPDFFEAARSLPADHWKELGWNRVAHLRHYFWSHNPWQTGVSESLRPISLTTSFGIVMTAALLWELRRHVRSAFFWTAVAGPLLLFHLHMGQAFPQFHILPTPFFAACRVGSRGRPPRSQVDRDSRSSSSRSSTSCSYLRWS